MRVLVVGSGAREHALVWRLSQSTRITKMFVAPGNAGTDGIAENVPIGKENIAALVDFAFQKKIDLAVVGPEGPLALGLVDSFQEKGLPVFGPSREASRIEWSKIFAKRLMEFEGIPTAPFKVFYTHLEALRSVARSKYPLVLKADGLATGKGVRVCESYRDARSAIETIMFPIVVEDFIAGEELSLHALSDGAEFLLFPPSRDYKRLLDGNRGPNTGGMGTYAPCTTWRTQNIFESEFRSTVEGALRGLEKRYSPFVGCLFPGLMVTSSGPKVLEYNARFGDSEAQVYMRLFESSLIDVIEACLQKNLARVAPQWSEGYAVCVVLASEGYPDKYQTWIPMYGLDEAERIPGVVIFHAGTVRQGKHVYANGGRVLSVTATGPTLKEARLRAYHAVELIRFSGSYCRTDIAADAL